MYFLYLSIEFSTEIDMSIKKIKSKENNIIKNKNSKFSFKDLNSIRSRIDLIDDNIHELLINRAKLVEKVAKTKKSLMEKSLGLYRPDREHAILKRIISNHKGTFPVRSLVASWSELFSGYRSMQGNLTISFIKKNEMITKNHFGVSSRYFIRKNSNQIIDSIIEKKADIGVLPFPNPRDRWCCRLINLKELNIIGSIQDSSHSRKISRLLIIGKQKKVYSSSNMVLILLSIKNNYVDELKKFLDLNSFKLFNIFKVEQNKSMILVGFHSLKDKDISNKLSILKTKSNPEIKLQTVILGGFEYEEVFKIDK